MFSSITCFGTIKRLGTNVKRGESARTCAEARDKFALCLLRAPDGKRAASRRGQGQERFDPTVQVKVRPGEVNKSWRPTWDQEALQRRRPRTSWSAPNESPTGQEEQRRRRPRPSSSAPNESPTYQGKGMLDAQQLAPNVIKKRLGRGRIKDLPSSIASTSTTPVMVGSGLITNRHSVTEMDSDSDAQLSSLASMDYLRREIAKL